MVDQHGKHRFSAMLSLHKKSKIQLFISLYVFSYLCTCKPYDATLENIGFDEVRVRYRAQRRTLIKDITLQNLQNEAMENAIIEHAQHNTPKAAQAGFIDNIKEDLATLNASKIAGLTVTPQELAA
jgi:hypothetical protein